MTSKIPKYLTLLLGLFCTYAYQVVADDIALANVTIADNKQSPSDNQAKPENSPNAVEAQAPVVDATTPATPVEQPPEEQTPSGAKAIKSIPIKNTYKFRGLKQSNSNPSEKPRQYELHGIMNKQYVYMIVEKTGKNDVVGYIFDGKGKKQYIYGEWVNKQLQIYDPSNKKFTVLLDDAPPAEPQAPKSDSFATFPTSNHNNVSEVNGKIDVSPGTDMKFTTIINNSSGSASPAEPLNTNKQTGHIGIR